jgi:hypothetical protein
MSGRTGTVYRTGVVFPTPFHEEHGAAADPDFHRHEEERKSYLAKSLMRQWFSGLSQVPWCLEHYRRRRVAPGFMLAM